MNRLDRLFELERQYVPRSRYTYKDESWIMGLAGVLIWPFNPQFMDRFTTTMGACTYFPRTFREPGMEDQAVMIECHEFVHKWDNRQHPIVYPLGYVFSWPYRREAETRGYVMSMYTQWLRYKVEVDPAQYVDYFTGPSYLWMDRNAERVYHELAGRQNWFLTDEEHFLSMPDSVPYRVIREFFKKEGMLHATLC